MKNQWAATKELFTPQECDSIIERAYSIAIDFEDATIGNEIYGKREVDYSFRKSKVKWMGRNIFDDVFDKLWKYTIDINHQYFGVHIDYLENMQFAEYDESYQGEFKHHQDVLWITENNRHRKLTCILHLTDPNDFEGCQLNLECENNDFPKDAWTKGTVVWFPSPFRHWVTPITKGRRNSVVCWFEGPQWR